jgi:hypothetical protein
MRLDELPRSDKVEDRRGDAPGGFPMGRAGGVGIGTIILLVLVGWALGINPLYLIGGAEILSGLRGSQQQSQPAPGNAKTESASDQMSEFVGRAWKHGSPMERNFRASRENLRGPDTSHVLWRHALSMQVCAIRHGPVLLPERSESLSRYRVLSGSRAYPAPTMT